MNNQWKEIVGYSLSAIGTIQAAIGNTPQFHLNKNLGYQLRLVGNVLQALGSALSADGQGMDSFEKIGDEIQATGNSTVITGMLVGDAWGEKIEQKLMITGLWMQALGSFVGLSDEFFDRTEDGRLENISGSLLQGIGNSLQAISGIQSLNENNSESDLVGVAGSWIQATGSVLSLIGQIQEESEEIHLNINE
ncbi:DUF6944 family repetitive protein [Anoxybacteroides rupiense]|uniref:DUF637 domain-containing protein n=1 Tax=Anoxybacteroides rupiense TaxID=311460 RepID=A0ABD5IZ68_9BACL|nr:hypothetical protein [Anoxybacillus rupiensis]MBB3906025.1 hypothetical protein [Anoxybacillus rupiensis]MBS2773205.1 hypothetical protein [Anoxybacillus rupiensis]MED5053660.1 hypothetical protein [Anoxybacillus rupiensis]